MADGSAWRPRNETAGDVARERAVVEAFMASWNELRPDGPVERAVKLSEVAYRIDYAIFGRRGRLRAFAEVKFRWKARMGTTRLSLAKAERLWTLSASAGVPGYVLVHAPDGLFVHRIHPLAQYERGLIENPRGQNGDVEPGIFMPGVEFKPVCGTIFGEVAA